MQLDFTCPDCQQSSRISSSLDEHRIECPECGFVKPIPESAWENTRLAECLACGEPDLWRQKDFPQKIGIGLVALGITLDHRLGTLPPRTRHRHPDAVRTPGFGVV